MSSSAMLGVATLSLLAGLVAAYRGRRNRFTALVLGGLTLVFVLLAAMFLAADSEYSLLIAAVLVLGTLGVAAAVGCTLLLTRSRPRARVSFTSRAAVPLVLLACVINPASKDLVQLMGGSHDVAFFGQGNTADHVSFNAHYRVPRLSVAPKVRRSFIFIYGEGLERTYLDQSLFPDLAVGLRGLETSGTTFTNISQTSGTSFTIGGLVGSQCGIPLVTSSGGNSMSGMSKFLPNAVCLGDLLSARGYHLSYLGGASLDFAGKGKFLKGHGFQDVQGRDQLASKLTDSTYQSAWGLHDDSLLDIAYDKFLELSSMSKPFGLFMLTLDTHHPDGHVSKSVADLTYENGDVPILNAVARADRMLSGFIRRVLDSPEGKDTLIVLCSDHLAMQNGATERLEKGNRRNLFTIIDPSQRQHVTIDKEGTTLDVAPTVLHALGYRGQLGLGRDLLGDERSLSQELPNFKASLEGWKDALSGFWGFSTLQNVVVNATDRTIEAGGTSILAPALITFNDEMEAEVFFEFNTHQSTLPDYVHRLPMGKPFVWVVDCARAAGYTDLDGAERNRALCVVAGRRGARPIVNQSVEVSSTVTRAQLQQVLKSQPTPQLQEYQTQRLAEAQLPSGLTTLAQSLPAQSTFLYSARHRTATYVEQYARRPDIDAKRFLWTQTVPQGPEFYFATPSLKAVRQDGRHRVRRLPLGDDLITLLQRHAQDTVILASKGDLSALSDPTLEHFARLGINLRELSQGGSFAAVLNANVLLAVAMSDRTPALLPSDALRTLGIDLVESAGRKAGNFVKIIVGGKELSKGRRGVNVVIIDRSGSVTALNVDTHQSERLLGDMYQATLKP